MFESLTGGKRQGGVAQPIMSFAVHASIITFALGAATTAPSEAGNPESFSEVIYVPAPIGTTSEVKTEQVPRLPSPVCECEVPIPGPIEPGKTEWPLPGIPGNPFPTLPRLPGRSVLDSAPSGAPAVHTEGDLTDSPVLVHFPQPVYPVALKSAGVEGMVTVAYIVDFRGSVEPGSIVIVSSDHPLMSESVRASLLAASFRPGLVRGMAVRTLVRQSIRFSLMSL
jgi:TonB family protein